MVARAKRFGLLNGERPHECQHRATVTTALGIQCLIRSGPNWYGVPKIPTEDRLVGDVNLVRGG